MKIGRNRAILKKKENIFNNKIFQIKSNQVKSNFSQ